MTPDTDSLGWRIDGAPQSVREIAAWLAVGTRLTGAATIAAECKTQALEFVYVDQRGDRVVVSDRGDTAKYFERGDEFHRPLDTDAIRQICQSSGATLVDVPDMWPHITVDADEVKDLAHAVRIVGETIDRVVDAALVIDR